MLFGGPGRDFIRSLGGDDHVDGGDGADYIDAGSGDDHVSGGAGNDYLAGRGGSDLIRGGADADILVGDGGPDILLGGSSGDVLLAGGGGDLLIGGLGGDQLSGMSRDDILVGGTTMFDTNDDALRALLAEWNSSGDVDTRIEGLMVADPVTGARLVPSGSGATVYDDQTLDTLQGGGGQELESGRALGLGRPVPAAIGLPKPPNCR